MGQTGARDVRIVRALHTAAVFTAVIKPHLPLILESDTKRSALYHVRTQGPDRSP
jgi:hypothetical protein